MLAHIAFAEGARVVLTAAGLAAGNVEVHRETPTTTADLPIAIIAIAKDSATPDGGGPRTGSPKFQHTTELVVAFQDRASSGPALRQKLYTACELIHEALLTAIDVWGGDFLEGIAGIETSYNLPPEGQDVMGAVEVKVKVLHRSLWEQTLPATAVDLSAVSVGLNVPDGTPQPGATIPVPTE